MKRSLFLVLVILSACTTTAPQPVQALPPRVEMATTAGTLTIRLLPEVAPATVAQFLKLAGGGVYDSLYFYRVEQKFVAQTATADDREIPMTAEQRALIAPIALEASPVKHQRGVISLAHGDDPNSGETSFSLLLGDAPHLDGQYTVFGVIMDGEDVLHRIEETFDQQARDAHGARLQIVKMTVLR